MKYKEILKTLFKVLTIGMIGKEVLSQPIQIQCPTMDANKTSLDMSVLIDKWGLRKCGETIPFEGNWWKVDCDGLSRTPDYMFEGEYYSTKGYSQECQGQDPLLSVGCNYRREKADPKTKEIRLTLEEREACKISKDNKVYVNPSFWTHGSSTTGYCDGYPMENNTASDCEIILATPKP